MILPFPPSFVRLALLISFFPHTYSLCLVNDFSFVLLQHRLISSTFWIIMDEQELRPSSPPFPCCVRPWSLRQIPTFNCQQWLHLCLISQPELSSTPAHLLPSIPTSMPASILYPSPAFTNPEFQQQRQGGSSSGFPFWQTPPTCQLPFRHQSLRFTSPQLPRNSTPLRINLRVSRARFAGRPRGRTNTRNWGWQGWWQPWPLSTYIHHDASHPRLFQIFLRMPL